MRLSKTLLASASVVALVACGGSQATQARVDPVEEERASPPQPVSASGSREARALVGAAGGTLSLANGARLEIPPNALSEPMEVALHVGASGHAFGDAERQRPLGPMLAVEPAIVAADGAAFVLSIPQLPLPSGFQVADLAFAIEETDEDARAIDTLATQTRWQFYPVQVEGGRFVVRTQGFAGHRVQFGVAR